MISQFNIILCLVHSLFIAVRLSIQFNPLQIKPLTAFLGRTMILNVGYWSAKHLHGRDRTWLYWGSQLGSTEKKKIEYFCSSP